MRLGSSSRTTTTNTTTWLTPPICRRNPLKQSYASLPPPPPHPSSSLGPLSSPSSLPVADLVSTRATPAPWWERLLNALWLPTKMCIMFIIFSCLWIILALPALDQKVQALFHSPWATRAHFSTTLPKEEDALWAKSPNHSQELKSSEEGSASPRQVPEETHAAVGQESQEAPKRPKKSKHRGIPKSVQWSDQTKSFGG